jgi:hypothetical protein
MELDCLMYDNVYFKCIREHAVYPIVCYTIDSKGETEEITFNWYGKYALLDTAKCVIFPKGKTTWEGFQRLFEPGDIVITDNNEHAFIYSGENDKFWECYCGVYCGTRNICINSKQWSDRQHKLRLATKKEIEKLFQVIKDNGYKWNPETKTLEKLIEPEFKVSDTIRHKILNVTHTITEIKDKYYILDEISFPHGLLPIKAQDEYELVPNKFDVRTLKPFDKVLVRDTKEQVWVADLFSHMVNRPLGGYTFACVGHYPSQCIPYEGNEHLLGKTEECKDFYKNW